MFCASALSCSHPMIPSMYPITSAHKKSSWKLCPAGMVIFPSSNSNPSNPQCEATSVIQIGVLAWPGTSSFKYSRNPINWSRTICQLVIGRLFQVSG